MTSSLAGISKRVLATLLFVGAAHAADLTPILMANGEQKMVCDGTMRYMNTVELDNKLVVKASLFGNLVTHPNYGADVVIWSPHYGGFGPLGDLHIFDHKLGGGRQGQFERTFSPDGVRI